MDENEIFKTLKGKVIKEITHAENDEDIIYLSVEGLDERVKLQVKQIDYDCETRIDVDLVKSIGIVEEALEDADDGALADIKLL